ncbi:MAG: phage baseplate protein [Chloroflexi bacterium]|nr:MAG: phage baseplate protein [Chloroflexota bacterium]
MSGTSGRKTDILGVGWAFPVGTDARGRVALARQENDIEQAIRLILLTPRGQRIMRPEFGCRIHELIFHPNDAATAGLAAYYVEEALGMWEPRIDVDSVHARADPLNNGRMLIDVHYTVRATLDARTLVFPFYRIPEEPAPAP